MTALEKTTSAWRNPRRWLIAVLLALLWSGVVWWQGIEHQRVRQSAKDARVQRGRDVTLILETVIRATRRMHTVSRHRLQEALTELARTRDLLSVAVVSPSGEAVAQAGTPLPEDRLQLPPGSELWAQNTLTLVEYVRLGTGPDQNAEDSEGVMAVEGFRGRRPGQNDKDTPDAPRKNPAEQGRRAEPGAPRAPPSAADVQRFIERLRNHDWRERRNRPYPPWMSEKQYRDMFEKQGLRKFTLVLNAEDVSEAIAKDRIQRLLFCLAALMVAASMFAGWLLSEKAMELRVDLLRAGDMNAHLREMNASATGLAHETRNPLNMVRGLARLIREHPHTDGEGAAHADTIMEEVDRINSRLDQFIAFSKPYQPQPGAVPLQALVADVFGTLEYDREDNSLTFRNEVPTLTVAADEDLLRQVLFNLLLNACQAVGRGGIIQVSASIDADSVSICVSDDGPGIPEDRREDVFRPYVSLRETGTGLGLAIVRQIAWAHKWTVSCEEAALGGARLVISGLRLTDPARTENRKDRLKTES